MNAHAEKAINAVLIPTLPIISGIIAFGPLAYVVTSAGFAGLMLSLIWLLIVGLGLVGNSIVVSYILYDATWGEW